MCKWGVWSGYLEIMTTSRRDFLALWAQAAFAAHQHSTSSTTAEGPYRFRVFSEEEVRTLRKLSAILIPADERSGGAAAARVEEYIDFIASHGEPSLQQEWHDGLKKLGSARHAEAELTKLSRKEFAPRAKDERFFVLLKSAVTEGFYTSEEGINKELGYQGMGFLVEFPDFSNVKAEKPANYKPLLRARS